MAIVLSILQDAGTVLYYTWWFWIFMIFFPLFTDTWLFWRQEMFKRDIDFVLLELRLPREVRKSPMAMEQVLAAIHSLRNVPGDPKEKWVSGEVTLTYSLELVSLGGEIHFYIRAYRKQQTLIEAAFFAYYPDVEVAEVEDYVKDLPENVTELYESGYDLWGIELLLNKPGAYPIKSYLDFEAPEEEKQYDPISLFLEVLGKAKREETLAIQIVISPLADAWKKHGEKVVEELSTKKTIGGKAPGAKIHMDFPHILPTFETVKTDAKTEGEKVLARTPGETDTLKAIEENLAKPGFETIIRFIYASPKELFFNPLARQGILGAFNQYSSTNMNSFVPNYETGTGTKMWVWPHIFPEKRTLLRKERMLMNFRERATPPKTDMGMQILSRWLNPVSSQTIMLSSRSLATLFHPPTWLVLTAPHVKRVESKKAGPPAGLPIYGGEEEVEKYR
ncbi:MAG: hypothetical protein P4L67_01125 [Candidatus Pacebacteria bacterium]|nr:hypothetical protein [Candidatus Paceibacterota bacterium]